MWVCVSCHKEKRCTIFTKVTNYRNYGKYTLGPFLSWQITRTSGESRRILFSIWAIGTDIEAIVDWKREFDVSVSFYRVFFWFFKIVAMILLQELSLFEWQKLYQKKYKLIKNEQVSPFDKMLDLHQNWDCDKGGSIESGILCSQRYAPVSLSIYWSFQMFFSLLVRSHFHFFLN